MIFTKIGKKFSLPKTITINFLDKLKQNYFMIILNSKIQSNILYKIISNYAL